MSIEIDERGRFVNRWDRINTPQSSNTDTSSSVRNSSFLTYRDGENVFITLVLFPVRLLCNIACFIFNIVKSICIGIYKAVKWFLVGSKETIVFLLFLIIAIIKTIVGLPAMLLLLLVSLLILIPVRIIVYICSFGKKHMFKGKIFKMPLIVRNWIIVSWRYQGAWKAKGIIKFILFLAIVYIAVVFVLLPNMSSLKLRFESLFQIALHSLKTNFSSFFM